MKRHFDWPQLGWAMTGAVAQVVVFSALCLSLGLTSLFH